MKRSVQLFCVIVCIAMPITLGACVNGSAGDFCALYQPVYTADADTEATRQQADMNNVIWLEMCAY